MNYKRLKKKEKVRKNDKKNKKKEKPSYDLKVIKSPVNIFLSKEGSKDSKIGGGRRRMLVTSLNCLW